MNKLLIILLFVSQISFGQRQIQHEPKRIFNQLNIGKATTVYAKENNLKKVTFYRDGKFSSSYEFDKNGNIIRAIGNENKVIKKTLRKHDNENRIIEVKHFGLDGSFNYGYYETYIDGIHTTYKLPDSTLFRRSSFIKGENVRISSEYDDNEELKTKTVHTFDNNMNWLLESRYQNNRLYVQYRYEYLENKKYVTKIQYNNNGTKVNENRYLDELKIDNRINHYSADDERLFRVENFDSNDNLIKMEILDKEGNPTRIESYEYNSNGKRTLVVKENLRKNQKTVYKYKYDKLDRIKLVTKEFNGKKEKFSYEYETY